MKNPSLLVISDTHGNTISLKAVLKWGKKHDVDALAFLGDGTDDISMAILETGFSAPVKIVRGNGDHTHKIPFADTLEFAGHTFFITHGHLSRVSEGLGGLVAAARSCGADAALYGHTHTPFWEEIEGILVLNPGSVGAPRSIIGTSFAVIECPPKEWFKIHYWSIRDGVGGKVIKELSL